MLLQKSSSRINLLKIIIASAVLLCILASGSLAQDNGAAENSKGAAAYAMQDYATALQ